MGTDSRERAARSGDALLDDELARRVLAAWGARFGDPVPWVAGELLRGVLLSAAADAPPSVGLAEAAAGLGVLRAQQGHDAAALVEDLLSLRAPLEQAAGGPVPRLTSCLEQALRSGVGALTTERAAPTAGSHAPTRDPLTGLLTRAVLVEHLTHEVLSAARYGAPSLVVLDLDGLTRFMDVHGHLAGDLHLLRTAEILVAASRRSDLLARLGVDQVALVLPRTDLTRALVVARRVLARSLADARAGERAEPGSTLEAPRLSVGVGWLSAPASAADLLDAAQQALGHARRAGGRVVETNRPEAAEIPRVAPSVAVETRPLVVR
ncbi:MAG: putative sensory protein of a two component system [Frankiales bacterium]|nr:putative sensory protein of a two component system [Frankiales bacterium]